MSKSLKPANAQDRYPRVLRVNYGFTGRYTDESASAQFVQALQLFRIRFCMQAGKIKEISSGKIDDKDAPKRTLTNLKAVLQSTIPPPQPFGDFNLSEEFFQPRNCLFLLICQVLI